MRRKVALLGLADSSFQNDALLSGRDRRVRDKDAGRLRSSATGATEDAVSRRLARTRQPRVHMGTLAHVRFELEFRCCGSRAPKAETSEGRRM